MRGTAGSTLHATSTAAASAFSTFTTPTEQHYFIGYDFGGIALVAIFVVVTARLQTAFDIDLFALGEVLGNTFVAPENDVVPVGLILPVACACIFDPTGSRDRETADRDALGSKLRFGIFAEIAD